LASYTRAATGTALRVGGQVLAVQRADDAVLAQEYFLQSLVGEGRDAVHPERAKDLVQEDLVVLLELVRAAVDAVVGAAVVAGPAVLAAAVGAGVAAHPQRAAGEVDAAVVPAAPPDVPLRGMDDVVALGGLVAVLHRVHDPVVGLVDHPEEHAVDAAVRGVLE
jgi:hypothetical protein